MARDVRVRVRVRVLMVDYGMDRLPSRSGVALLRREARWRGLEDQFDGRYVTFPVHTKAVIVDERLVLSGSMNFHFSAWGPLGLNEGALATRTCRRLPNSAPCSTPSGRPTASLCRREGMVAAAPDPYAERDRRPARPPSPVNR
jgi:hypothetical protein